MRDTTKVALGLVGAWVANDIEELLTMRAGSVRAMERMPRVVPLPEGMRERGWSQLHVNTAIGITGVVVSSIAARGALTGGRSSLFRGGVLAFGLHGFGHIAGAVALRGYASGVATSPTVVIPMWLWGRKVLRRNGLRDDDAAALAWQPAIFALLPGVHALTWTILRERSIGPEPLAS